MSSWTEDRGGGEVITGGTEGRSDSVNSHNDKPVNELRTCSDQRAMERESHPLEIFTKKESTETTGSVYSSVDVGPRSRFEVSKREKCSSSVSRDKRIYEI